MPRDGSQRYRLPFPPVEEDTTIDAGVYNGFTADVAGDLNAPRPLLSGGTAADNARDAMINLNGEIAKQLVSNYDSYPWVPGSFYSPNTAGLPGAPVDGHAFAGVCYLSDNNNIVIEARDQNDTVVPGRVYVREKKAGLWSAWLLAADDKLDINGDTMLGNLAIHASNPIFALDKTASGQQSSLVGSLNGKARWSMLLGDTAAETATDLEGSNFDVYRHRNDGTPMDAPITIARLDGIVKLNGHARVSVDGDTMTGPLSLPAAFPTLPTHAASKDYVDKAPRQISPQTASYTFVATDAGKLFYMGSGAEAWFVIPTNATVPFPIGTQIDLVSWTGQIVRVYPNPGVALQSEDGRRRLRGPYATATLVKLDAGDTWLLSGSLIP